MVFLLLNGPCPCSCPRSSCYTPALSSARGRIGCPYLFVLSSGLCVLAGTLWQVVSRCNEHYVPTSVPFCSGQSAGHWNMGVLCTPGYEPSTLYIRESAI